jgi:hypothetical protein
MFWSNSATLNTLWNEIDLGIEAASKIHSAVEQQVHHCDRTSGTMRAELQSGPDSDLVYWRRNLYRRGHQESVCVLDSHFFCWIGSADTAKPKPREEYAVLVRLRSAGEATQCW